MATHRLLETRTTSFGELIGNGRRYKVPAFQRDYAWNLENWEDLWQDVLVSHERQVPHFMGAIVTQTVENAAQVLGGENEVIGFGNAVPGFSRQLFTVIDGQQRLATLSILAIAVIQKIDQLVEKGIDSEANRARQEILRRTYLGDRNPSSLRYASKLSLNENDDGFYQNNLVNLRAPKNIYALTSSERLLWQAFEYFSQQLEAQSKISQKGVLLADFLTETVAQQLVFIQISVEDETNAYVLFETLNSRGVELGATDLLKNYIFSLLRGPDDHNAARYEWQKITRTVGMADFPMFLKNFLSMTRKRVGRHRLFKLTRESIGSAEQAFDLLEQLSEYSDLYIALGNPNEDFWKGYANSQGMRSHIYELNLLGAKLVYPALFAAYTSFSEQDFAKLLKLVNILFFRYSTVSGLNPNELEHKCNLLAIDISNSTIKTPREAFNILSSLYVSDDKFRQDFSQLSIPSKRNKRIVKYVLTQLEKDATGKGVDADSFSIEHILPQEPTESWRQSFSNHEIDSLTYRLGNMTPLEPALNRDIGRADYKTKQVTYWESAYQTTQHIQSEEWTADAITRRQARMAKRAVHVWRIDFDG